MNQICVRKNEDYFILRYYIDPYIVQGDTIVVPDSTIDINFKLQINGVSLLQKEGGSLLEEFSLRILQSPVWEQLDYHSDLFLTEECSLTLRLSCNIFNSLRGSMAQVPTKVLSRIEIGFEFLTPRNKAPLSDIVDGLNYLLASLLLNLEYKLPFVFSFYGRRFFKQTYNWAARNLEEFSDTREIYRECSQKSSAACGAVSVPHSHDNALLLMFQRLQSKILREFNTLNVWKEAELQRIKINRAPRELQDNSQSESVSVKANIYSILVLCSGNQRDSSQ